MDCNSIKSNPSTQRIWYEVFLSFRGKDTRNSFVDHLFVTLQKSGIFTFKDDERLSKGEVISTELPKAIEESRISIVVFSKNYADSTWCLRELAKIADCNMVLGQTVLPVFYDVDPSEVRKQSGNYGKSFAEYEKKFKDNLDLVNTWRIAMSKVADLSGWDVRNKGESRVIDEIVQKALSILGHKFSSLAYDLVGIKSRVEALEKILDLDSNDNDVRVLGITGMGGIGKTTLARVVYDRISHKFDASSFLMNVSQSSKGDGVLHLQEQLLSETLKTENLKIWNVFEGATWISSRLTNLRTLLVLDNVNHLDELENLAKKPNWFGAGSRIIITTRNEHILNNYEVYDIYRVGQLNDDEALELLCRKAFKQDGPVSDYEELTHKVLKYVKGLPLATKVLGSCLCNKAVSVWECTLARLHENLEKEVMDVLRTSLDGLQPSELEIFLDVACFFHGMFKDDVKRILDCCGFHPESGISNLNDKSLLSIEFNRIEMHDLLQELGRNIVQENFPKRPEKWSRLWLYENFHHVMMERKVTEDVEAIVLNYTNGTTLRAESLSNISQLRLLIIHNVNFCGSLNSLSNKLKYLEWYEYPFTYLPSSFQPYKLVELIMPYSCIKKVWEGLKLLPYLRSINLKHSKNLIEMPDFRGLPNLERLDLEGCTKLLKLDESIGVLTKLSFLNLNHCNSLVDIPHCIFGLSSLETLRLSGCSILGKHLQKTRHVEEVDRTGQSIVSTVHKILMIPINLFSGRDKRSCGLSLDSLSSLSSLKFLDLSYRHLSELPDSIGSLPCLEDLHLSGNDFVTLPSSIIKLLKLRSLFLNDCKKLQSLPELPSNIYSSIDVHPIYSAGLFIFNSSSFLDNEGCSRLAMSWLITFFEDPQLQKLDVPFKDFIVGSEIPWWFIRQGLGASIRIRVPPCVRESDMLGVALCATFVALDPHPPETHFYCSIDDWKFVQFGVGMTEEPIVVGLDHLWVIYVPRGEVETKVEGKEHVDFKFKALPGWEIKKCGVRWLFKESLKRLKHQVMHCGSNMQIHDHHDLGTADLFESNSSVAENWSE